MTVATLKLRDTKFFPGGFVIRDLAKMKVSDGATAQFSAIWRPGTGEQHWVSGLDHEEFKAKDAAFFEKGLRLKVLDIEGGSFAAVWRPGSGEQRWASGLDHDEFKSKDADFFDKGLRLEQIGEEFGDFSGVWRPGTGEQRWASGMDLDEFKAKDAEFFERGLRLVDVSVSGDGFAGASFGIAAVWRPGTGAQRWASRSTDHKQQLVELDTELRAENLRMEIVAVHR
jgi:hypothetical protein